MRLSHLCFVTVALTTGLSTSGFAEERRELRAHVHGQGILNIAVDGNKVGFDLRAPGADIVGFEHEAKSDKDKAALKDAKALLGSPLELFELADAAGCKLSSSFAHYTKDPDHAEHHKKHHGSDHGDHGHDKHDGHDDHGKHEGHDHDKDHHADHPGHQEGHAEFHAGYEFTCAAPAKLTAIQFPYFKAFKNARALDVNVVTAKAQSKFKVTADKPYLDLSGLM